MPSWLAYLIGVICAGVIGAWVIACVAMLWGYVSDRLRLRAYNKRLGRPKGSDWI